MRVVRYKYNPEKKGVFKVSVVKNPAVGEGDLVLMSAQEIKGVFYAPVMIPDLKIPRIDETTGEKYMAYYDVDTVEQLMHNYMKHNGNAQTNIEHSAVDIDGIYPVENWIVKDPDNDLSNALGMPAQKSGTWIQGYKCESSEMLEKIQSNLLQGLSIEGQLDTEEDKENPITKFNKHFMKKTPMEFAKHLANVIMAAVSDEEKPAEEPKETEEKEIEEVAEIVELTDLTEEVKTLKAQVSELTKTVDDLKVEKAKAENEAVLMSVQLEAIEKNFEAYKTVKMSSQKVGDEPRVEIPMSAIEKKQAKFLEDVRSKI